MVSSSALDYGGNDCMAFIAFLEINRCISTLFLKDSQMHIMVYRQESIPVRRS